MDRRTFLTGTRSALKPTQTQSVARTMSGLTTYAGAWGKEQIVHLLKRTMFGAKPADVNYFSSKTMVQAVTELLNTSAAVPPPPIKSLNNTANPPDDPTPLGQTWVNATYDGNNDGFRNQSLKRWWIGQMVNQDRTILEKMVLFWHNHFSNETNSVQDARSSYKQLALIRANAMGQLKPFVKAMTLDPSMLRYLNGYVNTKTAPDENYGRELQELFTVGKGPGSGYTEDDVKAASRVLTGYIYDFQTLVTTFSNVRHDTADKQFSPFYNNTKITGQAGPNGALELDDLLNMIFATNEVAMFMCRKIYRYFCYYTIDAATETNVITPLANIYRTNNYDIKPVLAALFQSEHFYDALNMGCVIKGPVDFVVGNAREFDMKFADASAFADQYDMWGWLQYYGAYLQQDIGDPPNVAGWQAYYQEPAFYETWINSDTLPHRNQYTDFMLFTGYKSRPGNIYLKIDPLMFAAAMTNPGDPDILIGDMLQIMYRVSISQVNKDYIKSVLLSGQTNNSYWTTAWNDYVAAPTDVTKKNIVTTRLQGVLKFIMCLSEYQLM